MMNARYTLVGLLALAAACQPSTQTSSTEPSEAMPTHQQPVAPNVWTAVADTNALGEGAFWYAEAQEFWWIDIEGKTLHTLDAEGVHHRYGMPSHIGTVVPDHAGQAVVSIVEGVQRFDRTTGAFTPIAHPHQGNGGVRYNDGKCDPQGRLWVGGMHWDQITGAAALYRVDSDGSYHEMRDSVTISNGLCWSADRKTMYYIDTPTGQVRAFGYDDATGSIDEGVVVVTVPDSLGYPDGMTIDAEGMLWIALWNGNSVTRWDPATGELLQQIFVPAHNVTSCAFGGPNLDTLYITTARLDMTEEEQAQFPEAGSVFAVVPGVKGVTMAILGGE